MRQSKVWCEQLWGAQFFLSANRHSQFTSGFLHWRLLEVTQQLQNSALTIWMAKAHTQLHSTVIKIYFPSNWSYNLARCRCSNSIIGELNFAAKNSNDITTIYWCIRRLIRQQRENQRLWQCSQWCKVLEGIFRRLGKVDSGKQWRYRSNVAENFTVSSEFAIIINVNVNLWRSCARFARKTTWREIFTQPRSHYHFFV